MTDWNTAAEAIARLLTEEAGNYATQTNNPHATAIAKVLTRLAGNIREGRGGTRSALEGYEFLIRQERGAA